jgi:hypothetical protein
VQRRIHSILPLLSLAGASGPPRAVEPLRPTSSWNLDYGYTQCTALRTYGGQQGPITLGIVQSPGGDTYELFFGAQHSHSTYTDELQGAVDFGSGPIQSWLLHYPNPSKVTINQYRITTTQMEQARSAARVVFHTEGAGDAAFILSDMAMLIDQMGRCTSDLRRFWNMDENVKHIATPAKGSVRALFTSDDYPKGAYFRAQEGTSQYLLLIDEKGSVAGCHVAVPSGVAILDAMGCAVLQSRTRLKPATDSTGKAVRSSWVTPPITWQMQSL